MATRESHRRLEAMDSPTFAVTILGVLTFLVATTILFERTQHYMVEASARGTERRAFETRGAERAGA